MPLYDFECSGCGCALSDVYLSMSDFRPEMYPHCKECGNSMAVVIGVCKFGVSTAYPQKVCQSCRKRDRVMVPFSKGGCNRGAKCRGYEPIDPKDCAKKQPAAKTRITQDGKPVTLKPSGRVWNSRRKLK